jgi:hypothetical protein
MFIIIKGIRFNINNIIEYRKEGNQSIHINDVKYWQNIKFDTEEERDKELKRIDNLLEKGLYFVSENRP